jgi:hypothetical protein
MSEQFVEIDLQQVVETAFTKEDLKKMANDRNAVQNVDWTSSVIEALEEVHWVETLLMDYIKANYK